MSSPDDPDSTAGEEPTGMPRWVRVLAIIAAVVVAALVILQFVGGGEHTPGRHGL
jgi:hypothetical protein